MSRKNEDEFELKMVTSAPNGNPNEDGLRFHSDKNGSSVILEKEMSEKSIEKKKKGSGSSWGNTLNHQRMPHWGCRCQARTPYEFNCLERLLTRS